MRIAAVLVVATWSAPPAQAVVPPIPDQARLPPARSPAPPGATEPVGPCHSAPRASRVEGPTQLDGLALPRLGPLSRGAGQTIAVIDTGVSRHRLLPRLLPGGDYVSYGDGTQDCDGHGTIVAGIAAAAPAADGDFAGVAPEAGVVAIRQSSNVFRRSNQQDGPGVGDVDTLALAIRTAADLGATVINVSSVACAAADVGIDDGALGAALAYAVDVKNAVVVAAAGNVGGPCEQNPGPDAARPGQPNWDTVKTVVSPSWYDEYVLTVGSVGTDGAASPFTLGGPWVDVAAPGEAVYSLNPDGEGFTDVTPGVDGGQPISGTSYAAPVVAGVAALIRSRAPHLSARQVMRRIEDTAHHPSAGWDPLVGYGVVDALAAVSAPGDSAPRTEPAPATVAPPAKPASADPRPRAVALTGTAACLATVALALAFSAGWLRRRGVTRD